MSHCGQTGRPIGVDDLAVKSARVGRQPVLPLRREGAMAGQGVGIPAPTVRRDQNVPKIKGVTGETLRSGDLPGELGTNPREGGAMEPEVAGPTVSRPQYGQQLDRQPPVFQHGGLATARRRT